MFIRLRLKTLESRLLQQIATIKAFWFIDLGILGHLGPVATVVQNPLMSARVRM